MAKPLSNEERYARAVANEIADYYEPPIEFTPEIILKCQELILDYYERGIAPEMAAEFIGHKLNLTRINRTFQ